MGHREASGMSVEDRPGASKAQLVSVAVLAYNEREGLSILLPQLDSLLREAFVHYEIVIVDDCSQDGTEGWLKSLADELPCVRTVRHSRNLGYAAASRTALTHSLGQFRVVMDGDGQHSPDQVLKVIRALAQGAEVVLPVRKSRVEPPKRRLASWLLALECRLLLGFPQRDINGGIKGIRASAIAQINIVHEANLVNPEIWVRSRNHSLAVGFVEVDQLKRLDGTASRVIRNSFTLFIAVTRYVVGLAREVDRSTDAVVIATDTPNVMT